MRRVHVGIILVLVLSCGAAIIITIVSGLGKSDARPVLVVHPFEVSVDPFDSLSLSGTSIADQLTAELSSMISEAEQCSTASKKKPEQPPWFGIIYSRPDPLRVETRAEGFSVSTLLYHFKQAPSPQHVVRGELFSQSEGVILGARLDNGPTYHVGPFLIEKEWKISRNRLASALLAHIRPRILGLFYQSQDRTVQALDVYRDWAKREPENFLPLLYAGLVLYQRGQRDQAIEAYRKALDRNPGSFEVQCVLGIAFAENGKIADATKAYTEALSLKPKSHELALWIAHVFRNNGRLEDAIQAYQKSLNINPNDPKVLAWLGDALRRTGRFEEAIDAYSKVLEHMPERREAGFVHGSLAEVLRREGREEEAQRHFGEAMRLAPAPMPIPDHGHSTNQPRAR